MKSRVKAERERGSSEKFLRSVFRVNVKGQGYVLLSEIEPGEFIECDLDVPSFNVSELYFATQKRIDEFTEKSPAKWTLAIASDGKEKVTVLSFGCKLPAKDEKGRAGISFIHSFECNHQLEVCDVLFRLLFLVSHYHARKLIDLIASVADGSSEVEELVEFSNAKNTSLSKMVNFSSSPLVWRQSIHSIKHDCGGMAPLAWMKITLCHIGHEEPWEIFEEVDSKSFVYTKSSLACGSTLYMSKLISELFHDHLLFEGLTSSGIRRLLLDKSPEEVTDFHEGKNQQNEHEFPLSPLNKEIKCHVGDVFLVKISAIKNGKLILENADSTWRIPIDSIPSISTKVKSSYLLNVTQKNFWWKSSQMLVLNGNEMDENEIAILNKCLPSR